MKSKKGMSIALFLSFSLPATVLFLMLFTMLHLNDPKFEVGKCVKGELYTYKVISKGRTSYVLNNITNNERWVINIRSKIVDKAFNKVECPK